MKLTLTETKELSLVVSQLKEGDLAKLIVKDGKAHICFMSIGSGVAGCLKLNAIDVEGEEQVGLSFKVLRSLARLSGNVELSTTEKQVRIKNYGTTYRFAKTVADFDVATLDSIEATKVFEFEAPFKSFKAAVKVAKNFANGFANAVFDGVYFEVENGALDIIATDTNYLSYFNFPVQGAPAEKKSFLLDKNSIQFLINAIDVLGRGEIRANDASIVVTDGESYIAIPQLFGEYPDAKSVVVAPFVSEDADKNFCRIKVLKEQIDNVAKALKMVVDRDTHLPFKYELPTDEKEYFTIKRAYRNDEEDVGYVETELFYEDICEDYNKIITDEMFPLEPFARFILPFKQDTEFTLFLPKQDAPVVVEDGRVMAGIGIFKDTFKGLAVTMPIRK